MTPAELRLAAKMLRLAGATYANHGCNDFRWPGSFPVEEREAFVRAMGLEPPGRDLEELVARSVGEFGPPDWTVMIALADKLNELAKDERPRVKLTTSVRPDIVLEGFEGCSDCADAVGCDERGICMIDAECG